MARMLMKRLLMASLILTLTFCVAVATAQTYQWGLPQAVQTPVVQPLGPRAPDFPAVTYPNAVSIKRVRRHVRPNLLPMPAIRKVTWPVCCVIPPPLTPLVVAPTWPMFFTVDAKILWQKAAISFHQDQLALTGTAPIGEFWISLIDPKAFKLRYSVTTQQLQSDTLTPTNAVMIGAAQVVAAHAATGQPAPLAGAAASGTPIRVDWSVGPNHRLDLVCLHISNMPTKFWLSPAFVANWMNFKITGTTTAPGTATTGSETFQKFYWAGGLEFVYEQPYTRISVLAVGSDKYLMADCSLAYSVGSNLDLTFGWQGKQVKMDRDTIARITAPTMGALVRFNAPL